jgi:hypothetical protein
VKILAAIAGRASKSRRAELVSEVLELVRDIHGWVRRDALTPVAPRRTGCQHSRPSTCGLPC